MALAALMCFAAAVTAAPKSISISNAPVNFGNDSIVNMSHALFVITGIKKETDNSERYWPDEMSPSSTAAMLTEEILTPFIPVSYTGNVSSIVYCMRKLNRITNCVDGTTETNEDMPAGLEYRISLPNSSLPPEATTIFDLLTASADIIIAVPDSGNAVSCDIYMSAPSLTPTPAFTLGTSLDVPVTIYAISLSTDEISHSLTATAGKNGTISPAGTVYVVAGASKDFTVTADRGYVIDTLTVDGAAVAAAAGQPAYTYTLESVSKDLTITASFKTATGQENVSGVELAGDGVTLAKDPVFVAGSDELVSSFDLYTGGSAELSFINDDGTAGDAVTFKKDEGGFVCAMTLDVAHPNNDGAAATFLLSPSGAPFDTAKKYYAVIQKKDKSGYSIFACKHAADGLLGVTVKPVGDYFTENTVAVYTGTVASAAGGDTPAGGGSGSGGGCSTGIAAFALLALAPLALRRKR